LNSELTAKQAELAQTKSDEDKAKINAEITKLKAAIAALKTTDNQDSAQSTSNAKKAENSKNASKAQMTAADKAAPESKVSGSAMDVLMRLGPQGGMMPPGGRNGAGGPPNISQIYADMDSDSNGKVTKDEFVADAKDHMSEDQAGKIFASIDSQNTGSITEDKFAKSLMRDHGHPPMGQRPEGMGFGPNGQQQAATTADSSDTTIA
jgi:membrane protein involved in colicin uptake